MATYWQIQKWVKENYGFYPKTCWIAHVKEICGLPVQRSPRRRGERRMNPCPPSKVEPIRAAFRHFGML
jgi:hypothetical protein